MIKNNSILLLLSALSQLLVGCLGQLMGQPMLLAGPGMDPSMMGPYGMGGPPLCPCASPLPPPPPPPPPAAPLPNCCDFYRGSAAPAVPFQQPYGMQQGLGYGSSGVGAGIMGQGMMMDQGYMPQPYQQFPSGASQQIQPVYSSAAAAAAAAGYGALASQAMAYPAAPQANNIPIQQAQLQPVPLPPPPPPQQQQQQQQQPQQLNENENSNTNLNINSDMTRQLLGRSLVGFPRN